MKSNGLLVTLLLVALLGLAAAPGLASDAAPQTIDLAPRDCCKICRKGKACGDGCISRDKKCNEPPGSACNE